MRNVTIKKSKAIFEKLTDLFRTKVQLVLDHKYAINILVSAEHAVSKPILVQGGAHVHQNLNEVMSPKSSESSNLFVKMAENVLGSSPVVNAKFVSFFIKFLLKTE